ncbi:MAG: bifunctional nuclease family protein [Bacteroidales bacterium]|nr:bifunctional nuclease family protein [Bacteroidales bacterium]
MKKIRLKIAGLSYSQTRAGAYALILEEEDGKRRLPVIIGTTEAQSIAIQLEGLKPYRPLTHDLFVSMASSFHIEVLEVNIVRLEEGIFYSEIICKREHAKIKIDSRTSDAVAIALRFKAPIFVKESIMTKAGMLFDEDKGKLVENSEDSKSEDTKKKYIDMTDDELNKLMEESVKNEDYETASLIRDELNKRKDNK